jgi:TRAP-type transport system small permease protein
VLLAAPPLPAPLALLGVIVDWIVVAIGAVMISIVFANVVFHLFGRDNAWTIELSEFLMVWVTFLGGASAARRHAHMAITELVDKLGPSGRRAADVAIQLVTAFILVLLAWFGMGIVNASWGNELTVLRIPMALQYLALPVGSLAMLAFVVWDIWQIVRGVPRDVRYASGEAQSDSRHPGPLDEAGSAHPGPLAQAAGPHPGPLPQAGEGERIPLSTRKRGEGKG